MDMTAINTPIMRMIPEIVPRINLKSLTHFCQYFFNISSCSQIDKFSISNLETSNLKNIPKLLVVRASGPLIIQGGTRYHWIAFAERPGGN